MSRMRTFVAPSSGVSSFALIAGVIIGPSLLGSLLTIPLGHGYAAPLFPAPLAGGWPVNDIIWDRLGNTAILAALRHRDATGEGQQIDMALLDTQVAWLVNEGMNHLHTEEVPRAWGTGHVSIVPYQAFPASDGYFILAVGTERPIEQPRISERMRASGGRPFESEVWRKGVRRRIAPRPPVLSMDDALAVTQRLYGEDNVFKKFLIRKGHVTDEELEALLGEARALPAVAGLGEPSRDHGGVEPQAREVMIGLLEARLGRRDAARASAAPASSTRCSPTEDAGTAARPGPGACQRRQADGTVLRPSKTPERKSRLRVGARAPRIAAHASSDSPARS